MSRKLRGKARRTTARPYESLLKVSLPSGLALDDTRLYVSQMLDEEILLYDRTTLQLVRTISGLACPCDLTLYNKSLLVADAHSDRVLSFSLEGEFQRVVHQVRSPRAVTVWRDFVVVASLEEYKGQIDLLLGGSALRATFVSKFHYGRPHLWSDPDMLYMALAQGGLNMHDKEGQERKTSYTTVGNYVRSGCVSNDALYLALWNETEGKKDHQVVKYDRQTQTCMETFASPRGALSGQMIVDKAGVLYACHSSGNVVLRWK